MSKFKFKVKNPSGEIKTGEKEAKDKFLLYKEFREAGNEIISVEEISGKKKIEIPLPGFLSGIKAHEKIIFAKNLGSMLEAGLPLSRALDVMTRQSKNKKLISVLISISEEISKGKTLSESMKLFPNIFSSLFISMVKAGEESGSLAESLKIVANQLDRSYALQRKVRGAMIYPCVILTLMVAIAILMLLFIVPTLTSTFADLNVDLPMSTKVIIGISDFIRFHYLATILIIVVATVGTYSFLKTKIGKKTVDYSVIKLPVIGEIIKEVNAARTARTFASLLTAGVDMIEALKITEDVLQNSYYKKVAEEAIGEVQKGSPVSKIFLAHTNLYPIFVGEMMSVGEETGKMGEMLKNVAVFYEDEVEQKTKDMSSIIEPLLMIIIGVGVGFFAISMIMPMYSLADKI